MRKQYLTVKEVAEMLALSEPLVRQLIQAGDIPAVRVGKFYRVVAAALDAYLEEALVAA